MENFTPTEEQLFDYFLQEVEDKALQDKIVSYLKTHPEVEQEFADWSVLESRYHDLPAPEPSTQTLNAVLKCAAKQGSTQKATSFWDRFQNPVFVRKWTLTFSMAITLGVSFALVRILVPAGDATLATIENEEINGSHLASTHNSETLDKFTAQDASLETWATEAFASAKQNFQEENFKDASKDFAKIISKYPEFSEKKQLYKYWIEALKKTGQFEVAAQKKEILDRLESEDA